MATVETPVTTINELPIVTESRTYSRVGYRELDKDGKPVLTEGQEEWSYKVLSEDDARAAVEADKDEHGQPKGNVVIEATQTFGFDHANTVEAAQELFQNENGTGDKELCKQINNSIDVKLGNRVRSIMSAKDENGDFSFTPQEGVYSLREYIGQETAARGKSDFEKARAIFAKLPEDQKAVFLAMFQSISK